jgi:hypothetical protein
MQNKYNFHERNKITPKEWKWSLGESYHKSARFSKTAEQIDEEKMEFDREMEKHNHQMKQSAYEQSFLTENDNWGFGIGSDNMFSLQSANKREEASNKMAERQMVGQIGFNPFLSNNSYVDDVAIQENFLRPKPTSFEKEKFSQNE